MRLDAGFLERFAANLSEFLGGKCEVAIQEFSKEEETASLLGERVRFLDSQQGRLVKSCTTLIFDEEGAAIGAFHLNMDVTDLVLADSVIRRLVQVDQTNTDPSGKEAVFVENVDDVLEYFLKQIERQIGKPAAVMTREEKVQALSYLEEKGVFKISKASVALCERFQISKYTLYGYLDEARQA